MTITIEDELDMIKGRKAPAAIGGIATPAPAAPTTQGPADAPPPVPAQSSPPAPDPAPAPPVNAFAEPDVPLQRGEPLTFTPEAGSWDIMGAAWTRDTITGNVAAYADRQRTSLALEMFAALPKATQNALSLERQWPDFTQRQQWRSFEARIMEEAGKFVAANPGKWGDLPLTQEQFDARLIAQDQAALAEAQAILDQPGGGVSEFIGAVARDFTRPANLALMPLGGAATSLAKFIATEAALSGVSSAIALPGQYRAAERLDLPEPDAVQQVATDTFIGGAFAGVLGGAAKVFGWAYARDATTRTSLPEGANSLDFEAGVNAAEAAMTGNRTVQEDTAPQFTLPPGNVPYNEAAVLRSIIGVESGGNARAQNPNSSARGLGQFISSTWLNMMRKYRPELTEGRTANEVLALRDDPTINAEMTAMYTRENHAFLTGQGLPANPGELYMAHFMGPGGAAAALRAAPNTPLSSIMSPDAIAANATIRFEGKRFADFTTGDLRRWAAHKMRAAYDPNASSDMPIFTGEGTSRGYTGSGQVTAGDGPTIDVDYEIVDYSALIRAAGDLQPRDRSRIASDDWINATAARLDPAQLLASPNAAQGAPIVGPDNIIESGNGRAMAIGRAYERVPDRAAAYRATLEASGYTIPEGVTQPVLVARRRTALTPDQRRQFVVDAQDSGVAQMTPTEMARATARNLQAPVLARLDPTQPITSGANGDFVRAALATLPRSARNAMFDAGGALNASGQRQLREALFARAWPDPGLLARYAEGSAPELKSLIEALEAAAPNWAALRADIEAGLVTPDLDISGHVIDAMRLIGAARDTASRTGKALSGIISEMLDEVDLLEGALSPLTVALVRKFWVKGRAAPADQVADFLQRYADEARTAGRTGGMFDTPPPQAVLAKLDRDAFAGLPKELGQPRGFATPPTPVASAMPEEAFTAGATSPEVEAVQAEIRSDLEQFTDEQLERELARMRAENRDEKFTPPDPAKVPTQQTYRAEVDQWWTRELRSQNLTEPQGSLFVGGKHYLSIKFITQNHEIIRLLDPLFEVGLETPPMGLMQRIKATHAFRLTDNLWAMVRVKEAPESSSGLTPRADPIMDQAEIDAFDASSAISAARAGADEFTLTMPDGTKATIADALDDLDADAAADFQITFCTTNEGAA